MNEDLKKKNSNVKKLILGSFLGIMIGSLLGISYAAYTYTSSSVNNKLIAGDIYMRYKETTGLDISGAMPSTTYDNTKYFEFDIIGKNTSNRDVWYEIVLADGDKPNNRNTKLDDKFLKFTLYKGNEMVVNGVSYDDITNQRLYTGTIEKNTNTDTTTTYKLYMWIDNSVNIGNNNQDYTLAEWNDIYAAVKVNVNARNETSSSCFTLSNKDDTNMTATISAYDATCGGTDIIIPKVIDGYTITEYGTGAFANKGLTNAIMQKGVITINSGAFYGNKLTSVEIPNSVQTIETTAFQTNQLTDVTINGNNLVLTNNGAFGQNPIETLKIGMSGTVNIADGSDGGPFSGMSTLETVIIGDGVTTIGNQAFNGNQIETVQMGNGVQTIGNYAFYSNKLSSVEIPNSVTSIGNLAFYGNGLTNVVLGNHLQTIDYQAFENNQLTSLEIPDSVTTIGTQAFGSNQISSLTLGNHLQTIGERAFNNGNQITNLIIPDSVTTIGALAFENNQLTSLEIPNSVQTIGQAAFFSNQITNLTINGDNLTLTNNAAFQKNSIETLKIGMSGTVNIGDRAFEYSSGTGYESIKTVILGPGVQTIGNTAFSGNKIETVQIGNGVQTIGTAAFNSNQITNLIIPNSVQTIGTSAFYGNQISSLILGNHIQTIGNVAFYGNKIASVTIPSSVTSMPCNVFVNQKNNITTQITYENPNFTCSN